MKYRHLFIVILTACLLCTDTSNGLSFHCLTAPVLTAFLISWPTSFLPDKVREAIQILLGEAFIALCVVDVYCQIFFGTPITPQVLTNILLSDTRETHEFLSVFVSLGVILKWRITCLIVLAILLPMSLLCKWQIPMKKGQPWKMAGIVLLAFCAIMEIPATYHYAQLFLQHKNLKNIEALIFRHYHEEIPTPLHRVLFAYYASGQSAHVLEEIKRSTLSADIDSCSYLSPHIVLVIGESYNKYHSSLYGYHLPTAPSQQKRRENGELFPLSDAVTPWNITSNAILDIFSLGECDSEKQTGEYPLFPILFQKAGYKVTFFSNQYILKGFHKGATNQAGHFFLADGELSDKLFSFRNRRSDKYDLELVRKLANHMNERENEPYTLDIVHLIGQHFDYSLRYPPEAACFSASDYVDRNLGKDEQQTVIHYDNATRYCDTVLDSLLTLYDNKEAIVVFVSDHGEEVYDELPMQGRLFNEPTATVAKNEYEVPMWIWCSESYRTLHPDVVQQIMYASSKPFLTDGMPQLLLYLAGISCQWSDDTHNLLSPNYRCKPRIINGNTDYDKVLLH